MSQKPKFTHSAPLTADALAALFDAFALCETTREAMNEARAVLAVFGGVDDEGRGTRRQSRGDVKTLS
jgi:hypothetical protein